MGARARLDRSPCALRTPARRDWAAPEAASVSETNGKFALARLPSHPRLPVGQSPFDQSRKSNCGRPDFLGGPRLPLPTSSSLTPSSLRCPGPATQSLSRSR
ncbi:uncharacterized protein [Symphalangus syndactylus]|uniref:uncharacterized protein isoform X2 n=1 Tax=Symphalangus syndactylus TaxID=9590 RepID=UPI003004AE6F